MEQDNIREKQVELLYSHLPISILTGYIALTFISVILWNHVELSSYLIWVVVFNVILLYRITILLVHARKDRLGLGTKVWDRLNFAGTLMIGLIWGILTLYFSPSWPIETQVCLWVLLVALMSGASASFSVIYSYYLAYVLPIFLLSEWSQYVAGSYSMMVLFFFYMLLLSLTSVNFHNAQNSVIAQQMGLMQANIQLASLASNDPLTRLPNRRAFDDYLEKEWSRHVRATLPLSLMMIDVDHFKRYNDHYGHNMGDMCLRDIARIIEQTLLRPADKVARYGGEEFVVLLPETTRKGALEVAERVHENLASRGIVHETSTVSGHLTVSIGIATVTPGMADNPRFLLLMADRELYKAKANGRNLTSISDA